MRELRIEHSTEYRFGAPITLLPHRLLLRPRETHAIRVRSFDLEISPTPSVQWQRDALDNAVVLASFQGQAERLHIVSAVLIEHHDETPLNFMVEEYAVQHPFNYEASDRALLATFLAPCWPGEGAELDAWISEHQLCAGPMETFVLLDRLNRQIHDRFRYEVRLEPGVQSPAETIARGSGSCRDFASLLMEAGRRLGLACRFVSGYLYVPGGTPPGAGATHAWVEVYLPGPGWKGFDPTCGRITDVDHIPVAVGQHPEQVPPVAGSFRGALASPPQLFVSVDVERIS